MPHSPPRPPLLLILHAPDILLGHLLIRLGQVVEDLIAQIALDDDFLGGAAAGGLGDAAAGGKLLSQLLADFFEIEAKGLEAGDAGDVFALVALDAADGDFGGGELLGRAAQGQGRFGFFFGGVFGGALLGVRGEGGGCGGDGFWRGGGWVRGEGLGVEG